MNYTFVKFFIKLKINPRRNFRKSRKSMKNLVGTEYSHLQCRSPPLSSLNRKVKPKIVSVVKHMFKTKRTHQRTLPAGSSTFCLQIIRTSVVSQWGRVFFVAFGIIGTIVPFSWARSWPQLFGEVTQQETFQIHDQLSPLSKFEC